MWILDDADYLDPNGREEAIACCRDSRAVIAGNRVVADWCRQHSDNVSVVWVSHPIPARRSSRRNAERPAVVAWAHANPLSYPVEAAFVQDVILRLAKRRPFEFWIYGARNDEAYQRYLEPIRRAEVPVRTFGFMPRYEDYLETLHGVAVGLHPVCLEHPFSQGKSFGKILSYIASDVAVVTHDALDHSEFFRHGETGMLPNDVDGYVDCTDRLLADPELRQRMVDACYPDFVRQLSTPAAAEKVDAVLRSIL